MSCPVNALGRSNCQIIDYPDSPSHSFCATCQRRFMQLSVNASPQLPQQSNHEFGFLSILGGVCLALIMVSIVTEQSIDAPNAPDTPQPEVSQQGFRQEAFEGAKTPEKFILIKAQNVTTQAILTPIPLPLWERC